PDHLVDVVLEDRNLSTRVHPNGPGQVTLGDGGRHLGDGAHLRGERGGQLVDVVGQVAPCARGSRHFRLAAQPAFHADLASDARHLGCEHGQGAGHAVDGVGKLGDLALGLQGQLALQVAVGDRGDHARDAPHLVGEVARHYVHVVGKVFPDTGHTLDAGLPAQLAVSAHLTGDTGHLVGERVELVDHRVDGVLELEDLALDVDGDLLAEVAFCDRGHDACDTAYLLGQLTGHQVDVVGE